MALRAGANRNVAVLAASLFALALGEELWQAYMPAYLTALGASGIVVGLFASSKDLLDSLYQLPGGWLSDRLGRRRTLLLFTTLALAGYATYAAAPAWPFVMAGLVGVMAWKAGAFPTTFAVIGDSIPPARRGNAFAIQSVLVRAPRVFSPPLGAMAIAAFGLVGGVRLSCAITMMLASIVLAVQYRHLHDDRAVGAAVSSPTGGEIWFTMPPALRRLLAAECLVRIGEGIAAPFILLYLTQPGRISIAEYGALYALQQAVAIAFYLPGGRLADRAGRPGVIGLTFLFFAAFPLAVRVAGDGTGLLVAFLIGGLKEIGEPARKALIVDLAPDGRRARTVGMYYAVRNLLVVPAGLLGGVLWQQSLHLPFVVAFLVSLAGLMVFVVRAARTEPSPNV